MSKSKKIELSILPGSYSICKFQPDTPIPPWIRTASFFSITKTKTELSLVCDQNCIPDHIQAEHDWSIIKVHGPLDFQQTGIIAALALPLAVAEIPIFAISTYNTDYILVKHKKLEAAKNALRSKTTIII